MKKEIKIKRTVTEIESVLCNKCGKSLENEMNICGLSAEVTGQFDSTHLDDCTIYKFDLCEECLSGLFKSFKLSVEKENI